jgi:cobalt-zinc-cadmium efflux system membrane fusion protein
MNLNTEGPRVPDVSPSIRTRRLIISVGGSVALAGVMALVFAFTPPSGAESKPAPVKEEAAATPTSDVVAIAAGSPQLSSVVVEPAMAGSEAPVLATGRLTWDEDATVRVFSPVAGRVVGRPMTVGSRVQSGGLLATLSAPDFGQAQSEASRAATDLALARRTRDRVALLSEKGAAPRKDLEAAEADFARVTAEQARASARLKRLSAAVGPAGAELAVDGLFPLASPLAGVVVERNVTPGQEVRPDSPLPAFTVTDPSRLWVVLDVSERDLSRVHAGAPLRVISTAWPGKVFNGTLETIADALDPAARTVRARGRLRNGSGLLKGEMYVSVEVDEPSPRQGVVVPARAILTEGVRHVAFVEEAPGRYRRVRVEVGLERDGRLFVASGIAPGVRIVTDGSLLLASLLPGSGK